MSVPWWSVASASSAPVLLLGGSAVAASRHPDYDWVSQTVSMLAAVDAETRWLMTAFLVATGVCHMITAAGLRPVRERARVLLAVGGLATIAVGALPLPGETGGSAVAHRVAATLSVAVFVVWPAVAARRDRAGSPVSGAAESPGDAGHPGDSGLAGDSGPAGDSGHPDRCWALRHVVGYAVTGAFAVLAALFLLSLGGEGPTGLAQRIVLTAQALWPLVVVLALRTRQRRPVPSRG